MTLTEYCMQHPSCGLHAEWGTQNGALTPAMVLTSSNAKIWWACAACGHTWRDTVAHRVAGAACPHCAPHTRVRTPRGPRQDLTGQRFGRLTVLGYHGTEKETLWQCQCDCGRQVAVAQSSLTGGKTTSCGCKQAETRKKNFTDGIHFVEGTCIEKIAAKGTAKNNTAGFRGVSQRPNGTYRVSITFKQKRYYLGTYQTLEEAIAARTAGEVMVDEFVAAYRSGALHAAPAASHPAPTSAPSERGVN